METLIKIVGVLVIWLINVQLVMQSNRKISRDTRIKITKFFRVLPGRYNIKFAEKKLKIKKWKDKMPQMSDWSKNVYDKSKLNDSSIETLRFYLGEFEKGIYAHGLPPYLALFPVLFAWDNLYAQALNLLGFSLQVIYLMIQRYNYVRFSRVVAFKERKHNG